MSRQSLTPPPIPLTRAEALQSTFLLMSPRQLYEHFRGDYQTHDIGWSEEQASMVLQAWQRRFVQVSVGKVKGGFPEATLPPAPHTHPDSTASPGGSAGQRIPADPCFLLHHPGRHSAGVLGSQYHPCGRRLPAHGGSASSNLASPPASFTP